MKQFPISGKLSINKLNPWETAALTATLLFRHLSSLCTREKKNTTSNTTTELTFSSSYSLVWQCDSFPEVSSKQASWESYDFCLQAVVLL